jgi:putative tricarboxylic transport membrane protein
MDLFTNLAIGVEVAFTPINVLYAFVGCLLGTIIGVLPGIGPIATMSILLPVTYSLPATSALIMLAGIYYGSQYGGSTTAILINLPGEAGSVITVIDGHKMALAGRGGPALAVAAIGSFFAGCFGTIVLAAFATPLINLAFKIGPAEYFSLMLLGLMGAVTLASGSVLKSAGMVIVGILLGLIGTDINSGVERFVFNIPELSDGIGFVTLIMGLFGYGEIINNLSKRPDDQTVLVTKVGKLMPNKQECKLAIPAIARGTILGSIIGIIPGAGAAISAFLSYSVEKKIKLRPDEVPFGKGNIRGVAAPESANNAAAQTAFVPTLSLGIPGSASMAVLLGAMTIHNIQPGPMIMSNNPELFWGLIVSMWLGNVMLVILNLPLIGIWVKLLTIPYRWLYPAIMMFCVIGVYSVSNNTWDIWLIGLFGLVGYMFIKLELEPAPLLLGFVLGPMMEEKLRRTLLLSDGDWSVFVTREFSFGILAAIVILLIVAGFRKNK